MQAGLCEDFQAAAYRRRTKGKRLATSGEPLSDQLFLFRRLDFINSVSQLVQAGRKRAKIFTDGTSLL